MLINPRRGPEGSRIPGIHWLGRLLRQWRPDRNPLRRRSDRAEAAVLGVLVAVFCVVTPFAAHAAGSWAYAASAREAQEQKAAVHKVTATLLEKAPPWNGFAGAPGAAPEVHARWRAPDGQPRTGQLYVPDGGPAGGTVTIWTNQAGQLTNPPLQHSQVTDRAQVAWASVVSGLAAVLIAIGWLVHRLFDRRRLAAWDADWLATEPRWSPRR
jgi:hypothetical protein